MATKDKPPTMTRAAVLESVGRGEHVGTMAGHTIKTRHEVEIAFAPIVVDGVVHETKEIEAVIVRDDQGRLTRAGMERAIKLGGSVMWGGEVITDLDKLPDEVELARDSERAHGALAASLDSQMAALAQQRAKLGDKPRTASPADQLASTGHTRAELETMTVNDLRELADAEQIDLTGAGRKDEIIDTILKHERA